MKKVLVIFGGKSSEHEVSCLSAYNIINNLDKEKYRSEYIIIDKSGVWYEYTGNVENIKNNSCLKDIDNLREIKDIFGKLKKYDVTFPVLHGKNGEDGKIQGLFEMAGISYVGCSCLGSAIGMNKILSKKIMESNRVPVVSYVQVDKNDFIKSEYKKLVLKEINEKIGFPLIVKPNEEGSSIGVEKVDKLEELESSIERCFKYDTKVLVEKYVDLRQEVECAVLQEKDGNLIVSTPGEIVSANEYYDYEAKYESSASYSKIPADISEENIQKIKEYSKIIFKKLNLNGMARVDFFVRKNEIYFSEVNTIPGFTDISMYPKMLEHDNIPYSKILDILISNANRAK